MTRTKKCRSVELQGVIVTEAEGKTTRRRAHLGSWIGYQEPEPEPPPAPELPAGGVWEQPAYTLHVRLEINPNDKATIDDKFTLIGGDPAAREYEQVKTARDDSVDGDDYLDLVYTDLLPDMPYWLEVDPGKEGEKYFAFENMPWSQVEPIVRSN
jgi:hypothetical protein